MFRGSLATKDTKRASSGVRMVVEEEALSAVTSAPELPHNKTRCFQKNEFRIDIYSGV